MPLPPTHQDWMRQAIEAAREAGERGEVPVGAVVVCEGKAIAVGANRRERDRDPTAHAEIVVLRQAAQALDRWQLQGCTVYVTLEPCPMCAAALSQARIDRLVYGADDPKAGAIRTVLNIPASAASFHAPEAIGGVLAEPCKQLLEDWFARLRQEYGELR